MGVTDYRDVNRAVWAERAPAHAASTGYQTAAYVSDPAHLSHVVRFDLPLLGDVHGLRGVHLQCHIGTDTVSLARLGATMTGLDFSPKSLEQARLVEEAQHALDEVYRNSERRPRCSRSDFAAGFFGALAYVRETFRSGA